MLAGKMKLRTFLILVALGVTLLIGAIYKWGPKREKKAKTAEKPAEKPAEGEKKTEEGDKDEKKDEK